MNNKISLVIISIFLLAGVETALTGAGKPKIHVARDGFPTGHETPEGAACDLARAFIEHDPALLRSTCLQTSGHVPAKEEYEKFMQETVRSIKEDAAKPSPSPNGPKSIAKVFAARHLSHSGPASYGYAVFGFMEVEFVDVGVILRNGQRSLVRTLVIQGQDGKWYVHPAPQLSPLLSTGLNEEVASTVDFSEAYEVEK